MLSTGMLVKMDWRTSTRRCRLMITHPEYHPVCRRVQRLRAVPLVPPDLIRVVWNDCLTNPPWTADPVVHGNLRAFWDYFKNTWLPNRAKLDLCNHGDTQRTRTTKHAESITMALAPLLKPDATLLWAFFSELCSQFTMRSKCAR